MTCGRHCNRRVLLEHRVRLEQLVSLDVLRRRIALDRLTQLVSALDIPSRSAEDSNQDMFAAVLEFRCSNGELSVYVADLERVFGYPVRAEPFLGSCRCCSVRDSITEGRFITKTALLCHGSIDALLSGQPLYAYENELDKAFCMRPTSDARLKEIIKALIDEARADGRVWIKKALVEQVHKHPAVKSVGKRHIEQLAKEYWPADWSKGGRRRGT